MITEDTSLMETFPYYIGRGLLGGLVDACLPRRYRVARQKTKCLLPSCDTLTDHRGGYCSAEHCKQHREEIRKKK